MEKRAFSTPEKSKNKLTVIDRNNIIIPEKA